MCIKKLYQVVLCSALMCLLGSCTYGHEVDLSLRHGKLFLTFDGGKPTSVASLIVRELSAKSHMVWELKSVDYNGRELKELGYGEVPSGMTQRAAAEPLRIGQLYRVELDAVSGMGHEEFVISPEPTNGQTNQATILRE